MHTLAFEIADNILVVGYDSDRTDYIETVNGHA